MITNGRSATWRHQKGGRFKHGIKLHRARDTNGNGEEWILQNEHVEYHFVGDTATGARLNRFRRKEGNWFYNLSSSLWVLAVNRTDFVGNTKYVYPRAGTTDLGGGIRFIGVQSSGDTIVFTWRQIGLEAGAGIYCDVTLTATLVEDHLDLQMQLDSTGIVGETDQTVCVAGVCCGNFAFRPTPSKEADDVWTTPILNGQTTDNPIENMRKPRSLKESKIILGHDDRARLEYNTPIATSPASTTQRGVYSHPHGYMTIPMVSFGNRQTKEGFMLWAQDNDGCHAKTFNWWSDAQKDLKYSTNGTWNGALRVQIWDHSDHEFDPYSVGGKWAGAGVEAPVTNKIGWTTRLVPFVSPTKWVEYYPTVLWKTQVMPNHTYYRDPFWQRSEAGDLDPGIADTPLYVTSSSSRTPSEDVYSGIFSWVDEYNALTTGLGVERPIIPHHLQCATLGVSAGTGAYYGWEPWATGATGQYAYKAPDFLPVNSDVGPTFKELVKSGVVTMPYLLVNSDIVSGSTWFQEYSGYDMRSRGTADQARSGRWFPSMWQDGPAFGVSGALKLLSDQSHQNTPCMSLDIFFDKDLEITSGLAQSGATQYNDTLSNGGFGCYASGHYWLSGSTEIFTEHPRAIYSHYFNTRTQKFASGKYDMRSTYATEDYPGFSFPEVNDGEFFTDITLKWTPFHIQHGAQVDRVDGLTAVTGDGILGPVIGAGGLYWATAAPWRHATPVFNSVLGDRCGYFNWGSHINNAIGSSGKFWPIGRPTGLSGDSFGFQHVLNQINDRTGVIHTARYWMAFDYVQGGRLSIAHIEPEIDRLFPDAGWTGILPTHTGYMQDNEWTGMYHFAKDWIRSATQEREYMMHGLIKQPLEDWDVNMDYAPQSEFHRGTRWTRKQVKSGDESVLHVLRKHRTDDKYLLAMVNWTTGAVDATGLFNPSALDINGSYKVYDVDITTTGERNRRLIASRFARQNYTVEESFGGGQYKMMEFVPTSVIGNEDLCDLVSDYTPIRYSYTTTTLGEGSMVIPYSYGTSWDQTVSGQFVGYKAATTQSIVNNLPPWMAIRQNQLSRGWRVVNSWGQNLDNTVNLGSKSIADLFLETSDTARRTKVFYFDVNKPELLEERTFKNLLLNSSFSIPDAARTKLPAGWTDYHKPDSGQTVSLDKRVSLLGGHSVKITGGGTIGQMIPMSGITESMTASVYLLGAAEVTLIISVEKIDGSNVISEVKMTPSSKEWRRVITTATVNDETYRVQYTINSVGPGTVYICAPQLEVSATATPWTKSSKDTFRYLVGGQRFSQVQVYGSDLNQNKVTVHPVALLEDFMNMGVPTRVEARKSIPKELEPFGSQTYGRRVDFFDDAQPTEWAVENGKILERSTVTKFDVFGRYDVRDLRYFNEEQFGTISDQLSTITPLASAIRGDLLFVACKEEYWGQTIYTLKVVRPEPPPGGQTYLESIADFDLKLPFNVSLGLGMESETVSSIGFSEVDNSWVVVNTTSGRRLYYKMHFDYYYFDEGRKRLYMLEDYNGEGGSVQVT